MQRIGIGYEYYKDFLDHNLYYVDKTLLIKDVIDFGGAVTLFTRPRRFGKTLALSMLRTFFEEERDRDGNIVDNSRYFSGKKIMDCGDPEILSMMGKYPVIKLSLKSAKQPDFKTAIQKLSEEIAGEFRRHRYLESSERIDPSLKDKFLDLYLRNSDPVEPGKYSTALKTLSECLYEHHGKKVIILLDEYDVPLENAWYSGFYDEMVGFIRSLFESALKTNDALERAVITGCLRISRESIFTGLNHLMVNSIRGEDFSEYFGFTQAETEQMLIDYGLSEKIEEVREWYDGYLFGDSDVYNPWSVINYVANHRKNHDRFPEPYWSNTSSNTIIRELVENSTPEQKRELDILISGGTIEKQIHEDITYADVHENEDNLWNFLYFTGYMRKVSERQDEENVFLTMRIPNLEVKAVYSSQIRSWFEKRKKEISREPLYKAIENRDGKAIGAFLTEVLQKTISTFDSGEDFYHGLFLSLLYGMPYYAPRSNREEGDGRPDIVLYPENRTDPAIIFELKVRKEYKDMEEGLREAFAQIDDKRYEQGVLDEGYLGFVSFGGCFCKKSALIEFKAASEKSRGD